MRLSGKQRIAKSYARVPPPVPDQGGVYRVIIMTNKSVTIIASAMVMGKSVTMLPRYDVGGKHKTRPRAILRGGYISDHLSFRRTNSNTLATPRCVPLYR